MKNKKDEKLLVEDNCKLINNDIESKYGTPKGEETPRGEEINYKINEKIDFNKDLKQIIDENIKSFKAPKNTKEFIENQISLDYIISQKYKNKEIDYNKINKIYKGKNYAGMKELLKFYEKKKLKVYIIDSMDPEIYNDFQKYYFNENAFKEKITIHLNIDSNKLNDEEKVKKIINRIIEKISDIIKIPKEELYPTNIRKNCLIFSIFPFNILRRLVKYFDRRLLENNQRELNRFLENIEREMNGNNRNNFLYNNEANYRIRIENIIQNIFIPHNNNQIAFFNERYNKRLGHFGLRHFLFFPYHIEYSEKNRINYYYPNEKSEGFGIRVHCNHSHNYCSDDVFNPNSDWVIGYTNLLKTDISYKPNGIPKDVFQSENNGIIRTYKLFYQCKIKRSRIVEGQNFKITLRDQNDINDWVIPYRLIKEYENN